MGACYSIVCDTCKSYAELGKFKYIWSYEKLYDEEGKRKVDFDTEYAYIAEYLHIGTALKIMWFIYKHSGHSIFWHSDCGDLDYDYDWRIDLRNEDD